MTPPLKEMNTASISNLEFNFAIGRAQRFANADLADPRPHIREHDVHDANAAYGQRHLMVTSSRTRVRAFAISRRRSQQFSERLGLIDLALLMALTESPAGSVWAG